MPSPVSGESGGLDLRVDEDSLSSVNDERWSDNDIPRVQFLQLENWDVYPLAVGLARGTDVDFLRAADLTARRGEEGVVDRVGLERLELFKDRGTC